MAIASVFWSPRLQQGLLALCLAHALWPPVAQALSNPQADWTIPLSVCLILVMLLVRSSQLTTVTLAPIATLCLSGCLLLLLVPSATLAWVVVACVCAIFACYSTEKAAFWIGFCVALREPLAAVILELFSESVLMADASMVHRISQLLGWAVQQNGNVLQHANGHQLLILTGCSSYQNLSLVLLSWSCTLLFLHGRWPPAAIVHAILLMTLTLLTNLVRLLLLLKDADSYQYFHNLDGKALFDLWQVAYTLLFIYWSHRRYVSQNTDTVRVADAHS
ncbi:archaeosortase/exosortase family protein [Bowmanella sp. JS7-9]|uniref:Archaeosortase/exosortase family protein n=1 Tax=Pseudobowmanella zhangzhouensis TaxID=1537679 RepID=A0ABW1XJG4_9ALTE|nr:archaeosortase/exosortase family protein [Bowmanella sp. JS7-9]TBX24689.1 hypothetical protein TK45_04505 [Bowmanella sp. JS7-9]